MAIRSSSAAVGGTAGAVGLDAGASLAMCSSAGRGALELSTTGWRCRCSRFILPLAIAENCSDCQITAANRRTKRGPLPCLAGAEAVRHGARPRWCGRGAIPELCPWRPCRGNSRRASSGNVPAPWSKQWRARPQLDTGSWCRTPQPTGILRRQDRRADNRRHRRCRTRLAAGRANRVLASGGTVPALLERSHRPSPLPAVSALQALDVKELVRPLLRYFPWLRLQYPVQDKN